MIEPMSESPGDAERREQDEQPDTHSDGERRFEDRWKRDHSSDIPRTSTGGLPIGILIIAFAIFAVGFYLFRQWRKQYVDYSEIGSWGEQLTPLLSVLGLG